MAGTIYFEAKVSKQKTRESCTLSKTQRQIKANINYLGYETFFLGNNQISQAEIVGQNQKKPLSANWWQHIQRNGMLGNWLKVYNVFTLCNN